MWVQIPPASLFGFHLLNLFLSSLSFVFPKIRDNHEALSDYFFDFDVCLLFQLSDLGDDGGMSDVS